MSWDRVVEHSDDAGRTWQTVNIINPNSIVVAEMAGRSEGEVFDDGWGNLYRWRLAD